MSDKDIEEEIYSVFVQGYRRGAADTLRALKDSNAISEEVFDKAIENVNSVVEQMKKAGV